jgi:hypothetical protein
MLDATAKKSNFYYSLKKYIIDNLNRTEGILVIFDKFLPPAINVGRWLFVVQNTLDRDTVSEYRFDIYCVTRQDYEGDLLTELVDKVTGYFLYDETKTDTLIRIPFYSATTGNQIGSMVISDVKESDPVDAPDQSKFTILSIIAKMASKI